MVLNPLKDIGSQAGKVVFFTGGTGGIGREAIIQLASIEQPPEHILFTGRDATRAQSLIDQLAITAPAAKLTFIRCDLASFKSISESVEKFKVLEDKLDVLICNAGVLDLPPALTEDGYEIQFGTNHMGHAFLFKLLEPTLTHTVETFKSTPRIVVLTSKGHTICPRGGIVFGELKKPDSVEKMGPVSGGWSRYGQSKMANLVWGLELAKRYPSLSVAIIHPGIIQTEMIAGLTLFNKIFLYITSWFEMLTVEQGAYNTVWAATSDEVVSGSYYTPVGVLDRPTLPRREPDLPAKLWDWTELELVNAREVEH